MLYAALGDSITYGYDASKDSASYVRRFVRALSGKEKVNLYLHAKPGWTSKHLVKTLPKAPECIFDEAKLVTILVGGNDLLRASPWLLNGSHKNVYSVAQRVQDNLEEIVGMVKRKTNTLIIGTLYNPFPNSVLAEEYMDTVNKAILKIAHQHHIRIADIRRVFHQREHMLIEGYKRGILKDMRFRGNPIHPNDTGHAAIAREFLRVYRVSTGNARKGSQTKQMRTNPTRTKTR